jgi:hypothetical protein
MEKLDIKTPQGTHRVHVISEADRHALLRMLDEKPSFIIYNALQNAARRGIFTDTLLDRSQPKPKSFLRRTFKLIMLVAFSLLVSGLAYLGTQKIVAKFQTPQSVMPLPTNETTKATSKPNNKKEEVILARLSEGVRNAVRNHVAEPGGNANSTVNSAANSTANCSAFIAKQRAAEKAAAGATNKTLAASRPTESTDNWIKRITVLKNAGKTNELQTEIIKFRQTYPDAILPKALEAAACVD